MASSDSMKVCGIDINVIADFLVLYRDKYPIVNKASYFLEIQQGVSAINIAITNQRDAMSHLVSVLNHPEWTVEQQRQQIANAEEHLRRAAMEPYDVALALEIEKVFNSLEVYKASVTPRLADAQFQSAPSLSQLHTRLKAIREMRMSARGSKTENAWDASWENGLKLFVSAFENARQLLHDIDEWIGRAEQHKESRKTTRLHVWHILLSLLLFAIAWFLGKNIG